MKSCLTKPEYREKLAWIIDSTSSPVSVMIQFIGWGVYIMGLIESI